MASVDLFEQQEAQGADKARVTSQRLRSDSAARPEISVGLKSVANAAAFVFIAIPFVLYRLNALLFTESRAFPGWSQAMSLLPGLTGVYLRRAFYRLVLPACGTDLHISFGTVISHPTATFGDRVYVGVGCMLGDVTIEDDVLIGSHISVINGRKQHGIGRLDIPVREQPGEYPRVTIGQDAWIGDRAVVLADVARHCVVGAGAVVTRSIPEYEIVAGNPSRTLGLRCGPMKQATADDVV